MGVLKISYKAQNRTQEYESLSIRMGTVLEIILWELNRFGQNTTSISGINILNSFLNHGYTKYLGC